MDKVNVLDERLSRAEEEEAEKQERLYFYRRKVGDIRGALDRLPDGEGSAKERSRLQGLLAAAELEVSVWTEKAAFASNRANEIGRKFREETELTIKKKKPKR